MCRKADRLDANLSELSRKFNEKKLHDEDNLGMTQHQQSWSNFNFGPQGECPLTVVGISSSSSSCCCCRVEVRAFA